MRKVRERFPELVFKTLIRENTKLSEAPSYAPVLDYDPDGAATEDYRQLAQEILAQEDPSMPSPRTDKSTIPDNKNPIAAVTYPQPQPKPPIHNLISDTTKEAKAEAAPRLEEGRGQVRGKLAVAKSAEGQGDSACFEDLLERLRNAAWWQRKTLATLAEEGLRLVVERLERQHGGPFEPRGGPQDRTTPGHQERCQGPLK